jgi:hypothetical protein
MGHTLFQCVMPKACEWAAMHENQPTGDWLSVQQQEVQYEVGVTLDAMI